LFWCHIFSWLLKCDLSSLECTVVTLLLWCYFPHYCLFVCFQVFFLLYCFSPPFFIDLLLFLSLHPLFCSDCRRYIFLLCKCSSSVILTAHVAIVWSNPIIRKGQLYESSCVFFLYTFLLKFPSDFLVTITSRNGNCWSYSISIVNFTFCVSY